MSTYLENNKLIIENEAEFFKRLINSIGASVHIMKVNEEGNTLPVWMNEQYSKIFGYSFTERQKIGIDYKEGQLYHPEDIDIIKAGIKQAFEEREKNYAALFRAKTFQGNWKWVLSSIKALTFDKEDYLLCVIIDVTDNIEDSALLIERYSKELAALRNQLQIKELTKTEKQIIKELASGKTTKEIAELRNRSYETINNHKRNIFRKLEISKTSELVCFAVENGLN